MIPGLKIKDLARTSDPPGTEKINAVLLIVARREQYSKRLKARDNWIVPVPNESDIEPQLGTLSETATDAYRSVRNLAPESEVYMVGSYIPFGSGLTGFRELVRSIENPEILPLSIILCPELDLFSAAEPASSYLDRMPARRAICDFAQQWDQLYFFNLGPEVYGLQDAIAVCRYLKDEIPSLIDGHSSAWHGWGVGNSQPMNQAVDAAALTIAQNQFQSGVYLPAGQDILTAQPLNPMYHLSYLEAEQALEQALFSFSFKVPHGWALSGDATLGKDAWSRLSNRLACAMFRQRLMKRFAQHMFTSMAANPYNRSEVEANFVGPLTEECDRAVQDRILRAYQVVRLEGVEVPKISLRVRVQPFGSIHFLDIDLKGKDYE